MAPTFCLLHTPCTPVCPTEAASLVTMETWWDGESASIHLLLVVTWQQLPVECREQHLLAPLPVNCYQPPMIKYVVHDVLVVNVICT